MLENQYLGQWIGLLTYGLFVLALITVLGSKLIYSRTKFIEVWRSTLTRLIKRVSSSYLIWSFISALL